jgi:hypothetical protein
VSTITGVQSHGELSRERVNCRTVAALPLELEHLADLAEELLHTRRRKVASEGGGK